MRCMRYRPLSPTLVGTTPPPKLTSNPSIADPSPASPKEKDTPQRCSQLNASPRSNQSSPVPRFSLLSYLIVLCPFLPRSSLVYEYSCLPCGVKSAACRPPLTSASRLASRFGSRLQHVDSTIVESPIIAPMMDSSKLHQALSLHAHARLPPSSSLPLRTASSTPMSSPGLFSPSPSHFHQPTSLSESNTPAPALGSPYLHPLQNHRVREYVVSPRPRCPSLSHGWCFAILGPSPSPSPSPRRANPMCADGGHFAGRTRRSSTPTSSPAASR